jgi:glycosyltransferase involved in cell wall biosynthesis
MKRKVLVLGYFGYENNQLDGQTVKTRNIYELLKLKETEVNIKVKCFDTQSFKKNRFRIFSMLIAILKCNILIYIPAQNNLKYFFPILFFLSRLFKIKIHYIVIGGWLSSFIENKPLHIRCLSTVNGIYPETSDLILDLRDKYKFKNVYQLNNFRIHNFSVKNSKLIYSDSDNFKFVFFARVHKMKGVDVIFELSQKFRIEELKNIEIDIYGPLEANYEIEFYEQLSKYDNVNYKGILQNEKIYDTLENYDLMLFPTKFYTEGFPGSILDAYISGIPVIASRWRYANEFIVNDFSGIITDFNNDQDFINKCLKIVREPDKIRILKKNVILQRKKYSSELAWIIIKENVFL